MVTFTVCILFAKYYTPQFSFVLKINTASVFFAVKFQFRDEFKICLNFLAACSLTESFNMKSLNIKVSNFGKTKCMFKFVQNFTPKITIYCELLKSFYFSILQSPIVF